MSGPIVRSGASPEFSKNWDNIFGKPSKGGGAKSKSAAPAKSTPTKPAAKAKATAKSAKPKPAAKSAKAKPAAATKASAGKKKSGKK
jgi:hypothetical protein